MYSYYATTGMAPAIAAIFNYWAPKCAASIAKGLALPPVPGGPISCVGHVPGLPAGAKLRACINGVHNPSGQRVVLCLYKLGAKHGVQAIIVPL
jgi:hypothetical protein